MTRWDGNLMYEPPSPESQGMKYGTTCLSLAVSYFSTSGSLIQPRTPFLIASFWALGSESDFCHPSLKKLPWPLGPQK